MLSVWMYTIASVIVISLVSFTGLVTVFVDNRRLQSTVFVMVSVAVGAMLGDAFIHLLPEAFEQSPGSMAPPLFCLLGILIFFVLEKFLLWRHDHATEEHTHPVHPVGYMNLVADALHNFIDGILIAASFMVSVPIGIATTLAVLLHEIPQEICDFGVLLHAGFSRSKALWLNFLTAAVSIAGAVVTLLLGSWVENFSYAILPLTAGGFIYIAGSDLVPELHKERQPAKAAIQFVGIGVGIGLMLLLRLFE
jgi:zinc and cadmium transporter